MKEFQWCRVVCQKCCFLKPLVELCPSNAHLTPASQYLHALRRSSTEEQEWSIVFFYLNNLNLQFENQRNFLKDVFVLASNPQTEFTMLGGFAILLEMHAII